MEVLGRRKEGCGGSIAINRSNVKYMSRTRLSPKPLYGLRGASRFSSHPFKLMDRRCSGSGNRSTSDDLSNSLPILIFIGCEVEDMCTFTNITILCDTRKDLSHSRKQLVGIIFYYSSRLHYACGYVSFTLRCILFSNRVKCFSARNILRHAQYLSIARVACGTR